MPRLFYLSTHLLFENLHPVGILLDPRDKSLFDVVALAACDAEDEVVEAGAAEDVDVVA